MSYEKWGVQIFNFVIEVKALFVFFALVLMTVCTKRLSFVLINSLHSSFTQKQFLLVLPIKSSVG